MITETLYRSGLGLKQQVRGLLADDHRSPLIDRIRAAGGALTRGRITIRLPQTFGFCYGVERAVQYAYETRRAFPDRRVFLASPIIHNPQVNARLAEMGIGILNMADRRPEPETMNHEPQTNDVVIIPAFGVPVAAMARLRASGAVLVDTTCGSVMAVWKSADRLTRDGFTVVMHGDPAHEETRATLSRVDAAGGRWVVVKDAAEAERLGAWIGGAGRGETPVSPAAFSDGRLGRADPLLAFPFSPGFDPVRDLARIGLAHQTTMLASESRLIAKTLRQAVAARWGEDAVAGRFRDFDTICSATQDRQDAVEALCRDGIDLCLVVGGRNSHNTAHLAEVAGRFAPAYHIEGTEDVFGPEGIRHWKRKGPRSGVQGPKSHVQSHAAEFVTTLDLGPRTTSGWLPAGPVTLGLSSGASTPDAVLGAVAERVLGMGKKGI